MVGIAKAATAERAKVKGLGLVSGLGSRHSGVAVKVLAEGGRSAEGRGVEMKG